MDCACHGEPAYWHKCDRMIAGGHWRCAVTKREKQRAIDQGRRDIKAQRQRERYDSDPIYRIEKRIRDNARSRAATLKRKKETHGALPSEGRH